MRDGFSFIDKDGDTISPSGNAKAIATQIDGKVLVGGPFNRWNGKPVERVVRLNADSEILFGGDFEKWNGRRAGDFVRLNANGTQDTAFTTNSRTGADYGTECAAVQRDG